MTSIAPYVRRLKGRLAVAFVAFDLFDAALVEAACRSVGHRWRERFWTPTVTVLTFLRQVLQANCSCREAVAQTLALSDAKGLEIAGDPSAYSQSRQNLPRSALVMLNRRMVEAVRREAGGTRPWCGRDVVIVDGTSASMPDTSRSQRAWPQPSGQKPGCGFPVLRMAAIFCHASGCLLEWAVGSLQVSELTLIRRLYDTLKAGTVVLGDTFFGSYYDLALLGQRGLDGVFRLHQRRPTGRRIGTRLGDCDRRILWTKPKHKPRAVSDRAWAKVPETLAVRQVRLEIDLAGFRTKRLHVVTTLMDPVAYPAAKLAELYRDRWRVELNLRSLKTTLKMEVLKCKSPDMVLKELQVYQLAYNLIRMLMWRTARACGIDPRRLSFAGTQQRINAVLPRLAMCGTTEEFARITLALMERIAADRLPDRPNRIEPRAVKRRPKNYRRLTQPRAEARRLVYCIGA